jgi:hypothetical protein
VIIHDVVEQGSEEWLDLRRGKFTASIASKLLTPTGKVSSQFKGEIGRIIAESLGLQDPEPFMETYWMARGTDLEGEARDWFSVETDYPVEQVGFVESDSHLVGFSPDGVMVHDPLKPTFIWLELKVPKPSTHVKWLINGVLPSEHTGQVHFSMAVSGAPFGYFMSYNPDLQPLIVRVERDDYTEKMVDAIAVYENEFKWAFNLITGAEHAK